MKYLIATSIGLFLFVNSSFAQPANKQHKKKANKEKMHSLKVAHITKELQLTSDEATKFWPVYNEMEEKMRQTHKENKTPKKDHKPLKEMNDEELNVFINKKIAKKEQKLSIEKEYLDKFKSILPLLKVAQLQKAEKTFRKELIHQLKADKQKGMKAPHAPITPHELQGE